MDLLLLLALALAPCAAIVLYIYLRDHHEPEPVHLLLKTFLFGCFSVVPAIAMQQAVSYLGIDPHFSPVYTFAYAFYIVGLSEEGSKFLFLRYYAYPKKDFNEPFDGIVYSVMTGMGFATVENLFYVFGQGTFTDSIIAGVARIFTAVPAHATFAIVMGYYVGMAKFKPHRRKTLLAMGLVGAMVLHGFYDFFLIQRSSLALGLGAFVSLGLSLLLSLKAIRLHSDNSPFKGVPADTSELVDAPAPDEAEKENPFLDTQDTGKPDAEK